MLKVFKFFGCQITGEFIYDEDEISMLFFSKKFHGSDGGPGLLKIWNRPWDLRLSRVHLEMTWTWAWQYLIQKFHSTQLLENASFTHLWLWGNLILAGRHLPQSMLRLSCLILMSWLRAALLDTNSILRSSHWQSLS